MKTTKTKVGAATTEKAEIYCFKCSARIGIGYAYHILFDYKNPIGISEAGDVIYQDAWTRSGEGPSVALGQIKEMNIANTKEVQEGALVRLNIHVIWGSKEVTDNTQFIFSNNSKGKACYNATGTTLNAHINYEGTIGVTIAPMSGYAIPIEITSELDHTYAQANAQPYNCFGRSTGGTLICQGQGDPVASAIIANGKIDSDGNNDGHAGIVYGLTGVCHQTANRILSPAKILISKAKGYTLSSALYGDYGHFYHPYEMFLMAETTYFGKIHNLNLKYVTNLISENEFIEVGVRLLIDNFMGQGYAVANPNLAKLFIETRFNNLELNQNIHDGLISTIENANKVNNLALDLQRNVANLLDEADYTTLFGYTPNQEKLLVDMNQIITTI